MPQGCQIFDASGNLWLDVSDMTSRVVGRFVAQQGYTTSDSLVSGFYYRDYLCPDTTTPWAFAFPTNGSSASAIATRKNSTTATLAYQVLGLAGPQFLLIMGIVKQ